MACVTVTAAVKAAVKVAAGRKQCSRGSRRQAVIPLINMNWNNYLQQTQGKSPRPLLVRALSYVQNRGEALDLGCGALNDASTIIEAGFSNIDAVDGNTSIKIIADKIPKITFYPKTFDAFEFPVQKYDLVNAQYALPFAGIHFSYIWEGLTNSLKSNGIFTGQLFGTTDGWNDGTHPEIVFHNEPVALFSDFEIISIEEEITDKLLASGIKKHWHLFNIIARKK